MLCLVTKLRYTEYFVIVQRIMKIQRKGSQMKMRTDVFICLEANCSFLLFFTFACGLNLNVLPHQKFAQFMDMKNLDMCGAWHNLFLVIERETPVWGFSVPRAVIVTGVCSQLMRHSLLYHRNGRLVHSLYHWNNCQTCSCLAAAC